MTDFLSYHDRRERLSHTLRLIPPLPDALVQASVMYDRHIRDCLTRDQGDVENSEQNLKVDYAQSLIWQGSNSNLGKDHMSMLVSVDFQELSVDVRR